MPVSVQPHKSLTDLLHCVAPLLDAARQAEGERSHFPRPLTVLVPAGLFSEWLQVQLARLQGVCMGLEFLRPQQFVSQVAALAPQSQRTAIDPWTRDSLAWFILPELGEFAAQLGLPTDKPLAPREAFSTARLLADHFEHYGHSRPELIVAWKHGKPAPVQPSENNRFAREAEGWQRELWLRVEAKIQASPHARPHPCLQVLEQAQETAERAAAAYPHLFVLGTGGIDPLLVRTLKDLSEAGSTIEVHVVLPTLDYLGDLRSPALRAPLLLDPEMEPTLPAHPLLASLGRQSVGAFLLLGQLDENYAYWPEANLGFTERSLDEPAVSPAAPPPPEPSLLRHLQGAIQEQGQTEATAWRRTRIHATDTSLRVHSCHGPRRELEVLRDELLRAFEQLPDLHPEEVLVMCTDMDTYAPLAGPVLNSAFPALPVRLTEIAASACNPLMDAMAALLAFAQTRTPVSELLELLNLPCIQEALAVAEEPRSLDLLKGWLIDAGMTCDLDAEDRLAKDLPADPFGTLRFACDRLVAGMVFGPDCPSRDSEDRFALPLAGPLDGDQALRVCFLNWLDELAKQVREWRRPQGPQSWAARLALALETLLKVDIREQHSADFTKHLAFLQNIGVDEPVDAAVIEDWLRGLLIEKTASRTQINGDIAFGRFKQLTQLPCRVLALLGMQDKQFPRKNRTPTWDLLQLEPHRWDRNPRIEDRQLFLDALLAPSERLIITASTQNLRSGKKEPFASCVDELLRHVASNYQRIAYRCPQEGGNRDSLLVVHPLQPYSVHYFQASGLKSEGPIPRSYNAEAALVATQLHQRQLTELVDPPFFVPAKEASTPAAPILLSLTPSDLLRFWRDPARAWLSAEGISLPLEEPDDTEYDRAPLAMDTLKEWLSKDAILQNLLDHKAPAAYARDLLIAKRMLPSSKLGDSHWTTLQPKALSIAQVVAPLLQEQGHPLALQGTCAGVNYTIEGTLPFGLHRDERCVLLYRVGKYSSIKYVVDAWIQTTLATLAARHPVPCVIVDEESIQTDALVRRLSGMSLENAREQLEHLLTGLVQGRSAPLCYAPALAEKALTLFETEPPLDAQLISDRLLDTWTADSTYASGEGTTPAAQLAWRGRNPFSAELLPQWAYWAETIVGKAKVWFETSTEEMK